MSALQQVRAILDERGLLSNPPLDEAGLETLRTALGPLFRPELEALYRTFGPGVTTAFPPVIHRGVVNAWPIWPIETSLARLKRSDDPLWQLTPAMDIWLDTGEVTLLREDDTEQAFSTFEDFWAKRLEELETSRLELTTGLWLPTSLHPLLVDTDPAFVDLVTNDLFAGREVVLPGLGILRPVAPPAPSSAYDHNQAGSAPWLEMIGLDRLAPLDLEDLGDLADRWSREPSWIRERLRQLHHAVDQGLDAGPVNLCDLFLIIGKHHAARMLPSPDEPVEAPAYREVTARATRALVHRFADR